LTNSSPYAIIQPPVEGNRTGAKEERPYPNNYKMVTKNFFKKIKKGIDKPGQLCYIILRKRKERK
jgi:hypothetical protein